MRLHLLLNRYLALAILIVLLSARIGTVSHRNFVEPIQNFLLQQALLTEEETKQRSTYCKNKPVPELSSPWREADLLPLHAPMVSRMIPLPCDPVLPDFCRDIFIPPERAA